MLFETGLRYRAVAELAAPTRFRRGAEVLSLPNELDKARFGRTLPLTARAREALERNLPEGGGLIDTEGGEAKGGP